MKDRAADAQSFAKVRENYRRQALELWRRAAELQLAGCYEDALAKYREGLGYHEDDRVREHVWKLDDALSARRGSQTEKDAGARREAVAIWKEASALQQAGWFEDALRKYRKGLALYEDPRVREHVKKLERYIERLRMRGELPILARRQKPAETLTGFHALSMA